MSLLPPYEDKKMTSVLLAHQDNTRACALRAWRKTNNAGLWVYKRPRKRQCELQRAPCDLSSCTHRSFYTSAQWDYLWLPWWEQFWPRCGLQRPPLPRSRHKVCSYTARTNPMPTELPHKLFAVLVQNFETVHPKILHKSRPTRNVSIRAAHGSITANANTAVILS